MSESKKPASVGEAYLAALLASGVKHVFANGGTDFAPIIEGLVQMKGRGEPAPNFITVPHENVAMAMAQGYSKVSGEASCVMVHVNVGTANTICGLMNAARDNVPVLLAAGRTPLTETGHIGSRDVPIHWAQENFDQNGIVREHVKWDYELRHGQPINTIVSRAIEQAPTMLRKHDDLLRLARLLGLTEQSDQNRVIELIARALVSASDGRSLPVSEEGGKRRGRAGGEGDKIHLTEAAPLLSKLMGAGWANVWDLCERLACEEGSALRDDERLSFAAHALAHCPSRHSQRILARWQALRDKTVLCDHGGTPADAPSVPAWSSGEGIGDGVWAKPPPALMGFEEEDGRFDSKNQRNPGPSRKSKR
jgi:hypothetical protein